MSTQIQVTLGLRKARRTAALARATMALAGITLAAAGDAGSDARAMAAGFAVILVTALVELALPRASWLVLEESLAPVSAVLIVGLGPEWGTPGAILWLACVASGVLARGGRQHWYGRAVLLGSLALPIVLHRGVSTSYAVLCLATISLLLTCGRVTRELRGLHDRARHDADHDGLTGLLARDALRAELEGVARQLAAAPPVPGGSPPAALLLLNLDNFGQVNESAGHAAGDAVLVGVAERMRAVIGEAGTVGRLSGDEFAAILRADAGAGAGPASGAGSGAPRGRDLESLAADVLAAVAPALTGGVAAVRVSAGMALIPRDGEDADALLRAGDVALRVAKRSGGGRLSVYAGESMSHGRSSRPVETLERLIAGEGLRVVVQPIVAVADVTVHAYEALARFEAGAATSPLHWFALAESLGLRDRLELACLRAALELFDVRPPGTRLTVNLSGSLLEDPRLHALLSETGPLDGLILEVTENRELEDTPRIHAEISRLRARGVRFAVDDMGSGYSGLHQLMTLRPAYLKLDRSLISGIDADPERRALVVAMVAYAQQTDGRLVAEGVETAAELDTLRELGVPLVQGYHLARPGWPWPEVLVTAPARTGPAAPAAGVTALRVH